MIHLYMIFYDAETKASVPDGFIELPNTNPARKDLFEIEPILKTISSSEINPNEYYGFFSPRFFKKTGLTPIEISTLFERNIGDCDIVSLAPRPLYLSNFRNSIIQGERSHGDFARRFREFISAADHEKSLKLDEFIKNQIPHRYFLLSHYFIAKGSFWLKWAHYMSLCLSVEEKDRTIHALANAPCQYPGRDGNYNYLIFILERLAGLIAYSEGHDIQEAYFKKRCVFDFENSYPWPRWTTRLASPFFQLEERLRGEGSIPCSSLTALAFLRSKYIALDRLAARASRLFSRTR